MKKDNCEAAYQKPEFEIFVVDGLHSICNVSTNESTLDGVEYNDYGEL